ASPGETHRGHLGYYLVGDGQYEFGRELGYRPAWRDWPGLLLRRHPVAFYFGGLAAVTLALLALVLWLVGPHGWAAGLAVALVALLPVSQVAVALVNDVVCRILPPRVLPKLDFSRGVAGDCPTFVVIPGMLMRPESAAQLCDRLELHYLANPDPQLHFALLTDFADAPQETIPEDGSLVKAALDGVAALNARHAG